MFMLSAGAIVESGQTRGENHGSPSVSYGGLTITTTGGGDELVIFAKEDATGDSIIIPGTGSGIIKQAFSAFGYTGVINIRENSLLGVEISSCPKD